MLGDDERLANGGVRLVRNTEDCKNQEQSRKLDKETRSRERDDERALNIPR